MCHTQNGWVVEDVSRKEGEGSLRPEEGDEKDQAATCAARSESQPQKHFSEISTDVQSLGRGVPRLGRGTVQDPTLLKHSRRNKEGPTGNSPASGIGIPCTASGFV